MYQTTTKNILHFEDLEPKLFEKMYLDMLVACGKYENIKWFGLNGCDEGIDIKYTSIETGGKFFAQCKRYNKLSAAPLKRIIDRIIKDAVDYQGHTIVVVTSCEITKQAHDAYEQYALEKGFGKALFKGRGLIDAELHNVYPKILSRYFGIENHEDEQFAIKQIEDKKHGEELVVKKLLCKFGPLSGEQLMTLCQKPELRFASSELLIKSLFDKVYPESNDDNKPSTWFKTWSYNLYNEGIEIHMYAYTYAKIYIDNNLNWYLSTDKPASTPLLELKVNIIGRIPFYNIVDIEENGDMYYDFPIVTCRFNEDFGPIKSIHYEFRDDESNMRISFEKGKKPLISPYDINKLLNSKLVKKV